MKILVTDLDGTLFQNGVVDEVSLQKLDAFIEEGNKVVIATGRSYSRVKHLRRIVDAAYIIGCNGAIVLNSHGEIMEKHIISPSDVETIIKMYNDDMYMFVSDGINLTQITSPQTQITSDCVFISITLKNTNMNQLKILEQTIVNQELKVSCVINDVHLDIGAPNISKANGIKTVLKLLAPKNPQILVVGDNYNDISMCQEFNEYSYAINNGQDALKQIAKYNVNTVGEVINPNSINIYK